MELAPSSVLAAWSRKADSETAQLLRSLHNGQAVQTPCQETRLEATGGVRRSATHSLFDSPWRPPLQFIVGPGELQPWTSDAQCAQGSWSLREHNFAI